MNCLNSVILEGDVTQIEEFENRVTITIEMKRTFKNVSGKEETEIQFIELDAYNSIGTFAINNVKLGNRLRAVGRLKKTTWEDKTGKTHSRTSVIAEHIETKRG